jgi:tetratricopeptide (TPR) repeat protein
MGTQRVRITVCGWLGIVLVLIFGSSVFAARWYDYYLDAQRAIEKEDWKTAIAKLQQAIQTEPKSEKGKRAYGLRNIDYFPYLELGKAYLALGDLEAAHRACKQEQEKGVAPKTEVDKCLQAATAAPIPPTGTPLILPTDNGMYVAVLDFESLSVPSDLGKAVAEMLRTKLVELGVYTIIERGKLEEVMKEQALQLTGAVDSKTAVEIGKLVGAKFVIIGSLAKTAESHYTLNARLIEVETGIAKIGKMVEGKSEGDINTMVAQLALKLTGKDTAQE